MRLLTQPNCWTCCATAYAMLMDLTIEDVFHEAGHDGSEIVFPELPEPACHRGHVPYEFTEQALLFGYALTQFNVNTSAYHALLVLDNISTTYFAKGLAAHHATIETWYRPICSEEHGLHVLDVMMRKYDLMILGDNGKHCHYVAWDHKESLIYDPAGRTLLQPEFNCLAFWAKIPVPLLAD